MPTLYHILGLRICSFFCLAWAPGVFIIKLLLHYLQNQNPSKRRASLKFTTLQCVGLMILRRESGTVIASHGTQAGQPFASACAIYIANTHWAAGLCNTRETWAHSLLSFIITEPRRECSSYIDDLKGVKLEFCNYWLRQQNILPCLCLWWLFVRTMRNFFNCICMKYYFFYKSYLCSFLLNTICKLF
jgi:hypothetical protein